MIKPYWKFMRLLPVLLILLTFLIAVPVAAANQGLQVQGAILIADVSPGQTFMHQMTVSIGDADPATDITVQIGDFGQSLSGAYQMIDTPENNAFSARQFITVDKASFHLEPGAAEVITAAIHIPQDVGVGGRYAIIKIMAGASGAGSVKTITAVNVPIALTVKGTALTHQGKITELTVTAAGQPAAQAFNIATTFQNTGNHHFKVQGEITVINSKGETLDTVAVPLSSTSIIPNMSLQIQTIYTPKAVLVNGMYTVKSSVMLEDSTILDNKEANFEVKGSGVSVSPPTVTITPQSTTPATTAILPPTPSTTSGTINWPIVGGIAAGVVIVVLLVLLLHRRRD